MTPAEMARAAAVEDAVRLCESLSVREREALVLACAGLKTAAVALEMGVGRTTIHTLHTRIMRRLGCASMQEAAVIATKAGIV